MHEEARSLTGNIAMETARMKQEEQAGSRHRNKIGVTNMKTRDVGTKWNDVPDKE